MSRPKKERKKVLGKRSREKKKGLMLTGQKKKGGLKRGGRGWDTILLKGVFGGDLQRGG